jgi:periplasmic mercuric ion binding protein
MKTLKIFSILALTIGLCNFSFAQEKSDTFKVSGECGMCKKKIEKAAKAAGASYAAWDTKSKVLSVKYNSTSTNAAKIQQSIAGVGYDTPGFKATAEAYDKLDGCCKYERETVKTEKHEGCCSSMKEGACNMHGNEDCCKEGKCEMKVCKDAGCCKDGKCDMSVCKEKGCKKS